jgi:hypothetical protein
VFKKHIIKIMNEIREGRDMKLKDKKGRRERER